MVRIENGRKALVLGCGASGIAAAGFLYSRGWTVTVADTRKEPAGLAKLLAVAPDAEFTGGDMAASLADGKDIVMISPGLSPEHSGAAAVVAQARANGTEVVGEIELFARELMRLKAFRHYAPKIVGITGTNGKTTTTTIVGLMAEASGKKVAVAGNIGPNALSVLDEHLKANTLPDVWVLELSSFQLETTTSLVCDSAAYLNLTQDHVDWHGSMENYAAAKRRVFSEGSVRVLNRDDSETLIAAEGADASLVRTFGDSEPKAPGEWGISTESGFEWLSYMTGTPESPEKQGTKTRRSQLTQEDPEKKLLMPVSALQIRGRHNAMNALAAIALATAAGVPLAVCLSVLEKYRGEAHRVQFVLKTNGIEFVDDSKGTNVGATVAALVGLGRNGTKSSIILGGDSKGQDFAPIAKAIAEHARHVVLIGRDAPLIAKALEGLDVPVENAGTDFEKSVDIAYAVAKAGDAVLLSPACASWDMFSNYAERSARFIDRAKMIAAENEEAQKEDLTGNADEEKSSDASL